MSKERNGRHEETRTPDLYRVKRLTISNSTTYRRSRTAKVIENPPLFAPRAERVRNGKSESSRTYWSLSHICIERNDRSAICRRSADMKRYRW